MGLSRVVPSRAAALAAILVALGCGDGRPPNVLLVTLDTTRADRLGAYGHHRDTSPAFDALAADGVLYTNARSTSSWTLPSHASIFTGKFPSSHGARYDENGPMKLSVGAGRHAVRRARGLSPDEPTLARRLAEAGYATAGFAGGPWLLETFGLSAGFEHWDDDGIRNLNGRPAEDLADAVLAWLSAWEAGDERRPFFVFANFFDAHYPYEAPERYVRRFLPRGVMLNKMEERQFDALYDAEILYADTHLGRLLDFLRAEDLYDDTLVIVTADHGEMLGEHDAWGHNGLLFEPLVRVPLVVKPPGPRRPRVEEAPVQLRHLFGWVLEAAGLRSDLPALDDTILAEVWQEPDSGIGRWKVLWEGPLKYMEHGEGRHRLYDLARDPRERVNLVASRPEEARRLAQSLAARLAALPEPPPADATPQVVDAETLEALRRLGYLEPSESP